MKDTQIRAALDEHWAASATGDLEKEHDIYDDDVVVDYPQSGERIISRHNIQALRGHHPSKPAGFTIRRIIGNGDLWITEYVIDYDERHVPTVSIA
jgi:ketosteroid isomerase-like protein